LRVNTWQPKPSLEGGSDANVNASLVAKQVESSEVAQIHAPSPQPSYVDADVGSAAEVDLVANVMHDAAAYALEKLPSEPSHIGSTVRSTSAAGPVSQTAQAAHAVLPEAPPADINGLFVQGRCDVEMLPAQDSSADHQQPRVRVTMTVHNLDYYKLMANLSMLSKCESNIKDALLARLGPSFGPETMEVHFSPGSARTA